MADDVTLGEVYRLVKSVREEHGEVLGEIREQVVHINGTVGRHDVRLSGHDIEIRDLKIDRVRVPSIAADAITIPITTKTVTAVISVAGALIAAAALAWLKSGA
jgi:hypothetical protein